MEYTVLVYKAEEGGFWAEVPSLPGCFSQGETVEETMINVKEAVEAHILALTEEEEKIPKEEDFFIARINIAESAIV
jgi:predicted RNase H-like HicB family nuclease